MKIILKIMRGTLAVLGLAALGLLGYGLISGRLDQERRHQYAATWRGEKLVPPVVETQQTAMTESPQEASTRIAEAQIQDEIVSRELQQQMELLRDMKITVDLAQDQLTKDLKTLKTERDALVQELVVQRQKAQNEGFQKALKNYSQMKAKDVVADFMVMDDNDVVRYLSAMKSDVATKILSQFRSPAEREKRIRLMQMMENFNAVAVKK